MARVNRSRYAKPIRPGPETVSLERCCEMARAQGLAIVKLPGFVSARRRYAVVRADGPVSHTPLIYVGLRGLYKALKND